MIRKGNVSNPSCLSDNLFIMVLFQVTDKSIRVPLESKQIVLVQWGDDR